MSDEPKKKIMIKRKGGAKPAIKLNKPTKDAEAGESPAAEETAPIVDSAGRKKVAFKKKTTSAKPSSSPKKDEPAQEQAGKQETAPSAEATTDSGEQMEPEAKQPAAPEAAATEQVEGTILKFYCVYCGQKLSAHSSMAGKKITCPSCQNEIEIPVPPA